MPENDSRFCESLILLFSVLNMPTLRYSERIWTCYHAIVTSCGVDYNLTVSPPPPPPTHLHLDLDGDDKKENLGFKHSIKTLRGKHILTKTSTGLLVTLL